MAKTKYTAGSIWGNKQIIAFAGRNNSGSPQYEWRCLKCGGEYGPATGTDITKSEYSKCCPRRYDEKVNYKGHRLITGSKMTQYKDSARKRGLDFQVDAVYLWELWETQGGTCAYTGLPIALNEDASLDRIDSTKGYVPGNVHWVLWKVNRMKLNLPHEEFIQLCSLIAGRNGDNNDTD